MWLLGFNIEYTEGENPLAVLVGVLLLVLEERDDVLLRGFLEQLLVYAHHGDITHTREKQYINHMQQSKHRTRNNLLI